MFGSVEVNGCPQIVPHSHAQEWNRSIPRIRDKVSNWFILKFSKLSFESVFFFIYIHRKQLKKSGQLFSGRI